MPRIELRSATFFVQDTGIGISPDKHEEIFQAFTQVDASSARRYGGIGLGLAICDRLINAMGGEITLQSNIGEGTRIGFEVALHFCDDKIAELTELTKTSHEIKGLEVLMVEDDTTNRMVTNSYLTELGYRVISAETGEEAITILTKETPSLVLLDISLPGIDGLAILEHIRAHNNPLVADMPVVAMSAHVFTEEVDQYLAAGMNGFLGKPFSMEDLNNTVISVFGGQYR